MFRISFRHACRTLRRSPGFLVTAVLLLAFGLGAAAAGFTLLNHLLLNPLPSARLERLVFVDSLSKREGSMLPLGLCPPDAFTYRGQARSFEAAGLFLDPDEAQMDLGESRAKVPCWPASHDLPAVLGLRLPLGRPFLAEEDREGGEPVVLLGHGLWQKSFGGDPGVVGRSLRLDGRSHRIVGVLPTLRSSRFPDLDDGLMRPLAMPAEMAQRRTGGMVRMVARLRPGVSPAAANSELAILEKGLQWPKGLEMNGAADPRVRPFRELLVEEGRATGLLLQASTLLVLLIACVNVANLMLGRGIRRAKELALRSAVGATSRDLAGLVLAEGLLVAGLGALLGLGFGQFLLRLLCTFLTQLSSLTGGLSLTPTSYLAMVLLALLAALLSAGIPAWRLSRRPPLEELQSQRSSATGRQSRLARLLVGVEVALATGLLFASTMATRSLQALQSSSIGFAPRGRCRIVLEPGPGAPPLSVPGLRTQLESLPGVHGVTTCTLLPTSLHSGINGYELRAGASEPGTGEAVCNYVADNYFRILEIPLREGRPFGPGDAEHCVIVSESLARRHFPGRSVLGATLVSQGMGMDHPLEVVGVVGDVRAKEPGGRPVPMTYFPSFPMATAKRSVRFLLQLEHPSAMAQLRLNLPALAPGWELKEAISLEDRVKEQSASAQASVEVLSGFTLAALLQAGFGLFSVLSFLAATRRKEWAIRRGLGAEAPSLVGHVISQALPPVAFGLLAGFGLAWAARRALESLLLSLNPLEPLAILATLVGVLLLALAASLLPALQALRIQPAELLRSE